MTDIMENLDTTKDPYADCTCAVIFVKQCIDKGNPEIFQTWVKEGATIDEVVALVRITHERAVLTYGWDFPNGLLAIAHFRHQSTLPSFRRYIAGRMGAM